MPEYVVDVVGSPWVYVILASVVLADGVFTALPSDSLLICLSALSVSGEPSLILLAVSAAAGAVAGDFVAYTLGRRAVGRFGVPRRGAAAVAFDGARRALGRRGGVAIVVGHFLPGGRTATTLAAGWLAFPRHRFGAASALAGTLWAIYLCGLGRIGGLAFADRPFLGAVPGIVFGVLVTVFLQVRARRAVVHGVGPGPCRQPADR
ncbi:DedA family protein [Cryptosporangium arvum]|uniref:Putative membrane-associated protein n=1 Tax=Cryptosporangium arvum DSM 44712 TaxID=927661 RepID=A0A010ZTC4_9ACTN|nr:VTT domain-containing protein [Cryptosporangium arvum]EXG81959.1 putative membrane-associated protein [Cryptosporangium arvum DSM 44712]